MLTKLKIINFALIKNIELDFKENLTVFTGETGSGKSMLLGALQLISGEKLDSSKITPNNEKIIIEADFINNYQKVSTILLENDLDIEKTLTIRREFSNGKSRAFVNDTPVSLQILKDLSEQLLFIHSQHAILELKNPDFILDTVDVLSDSYNLRTEYKDKYQLFTNLKKQIEEYNQKLNNANKESDFIKFQIDELESLKLNSISYNELENQLEQIENKDKLEESYNYILHNLDGENQVIDKLLTTKSLLFKNINLSINFSNITERLNSIILELKELVNESTNSLDKLSNETIDKEVIQNQISKYNHCLLKHRVKSQEELISIYNNLTNSNYEIEKADQILNVLKESEKKTYNELLELDNKIQEKRKKSIPIIEKEIKTLLNELSLKDSTFKINLEKKELLSNNGSHIAKFYFSANKGSEIKLVEKIASGGELSRLMLIIQYLLSDKKSLPTLILDEIDTGISGEVAYKMAKMIKKMSSKMQMFVITHLPQVAAAGKQHLKVKKEIINNVSTTSVLNLDNKLKILEIAGLMSGKTINDAAIKNAELLINEINLKND